MTTLSKDFQDAIIAEKVVRAKLANGPDAQGGFTVVIATKKNSAGDLVVDKDGDIYRDSAVGVQLGVPIGCDQHADCGLEPAGFADTGEDEFVIFATGVLDLSSEHGLAQYAQWKERRETQEFSYRYFVNEQAPAMVNGRRVNELIRVTVVSIDPVSRGAGIDTGIRELKSDDPDCKCSGTCGCGDHDLKDAQELLQAERKRFDAIQNRQELTQLRSESERLINSHTLKSMRESQPDHFFYCEVEGSPATRSAAMFGIFKGLDRFSPGSETMPSIKYFREARDGDEVSFSTNEALHGRQLDNRIWISANLEDEKAAETGYHEAVHLSRPKMGESQVRVETGYFAEWLHNPNNRPNFDRMAASLEGSR